MQNEDQYFAPMRKKEKKRFFHSFSKWKKPGYLECRCINKKELMFSEMVQPQFCLAPETREAGAVLRAKAVPYSVKTLSHEVLVRSRNQTRNIPLLTDHRCTNQANKPLKLFFLLSANIVMMLKKTFFFFFLNFVLFTWICVPNLYEKKKQQQQKNKQKKTWGGISWD